TDADKVYERKGSRTISDTVGVRAGISKNARPSASKTAEISFLHARSPGNSSRPVEPISQTLAYKCPVCGREFKHQSCFIRHQQSHTSRQDFKCNMCSSAYKYSSKLREHMRKKHADNSLPLRKSTRAQMYASEQAGHPCPKCGKHFKSWAGLKKHRRAIHPEGVRHVCEKCVETFPLGVRAGISKNARPSASKTAEISTVHARSPGNSSRPVEPISQTLAYKCPVCGREFKHQSCFIRHQQSHTSRQDFKCNMCSSAYKYSSKLREHMRKKHADNSLPLRKSTRAQMYASEQAGHPCPKCGKHFKSWAGLKKHRRAIHPEGVRHVCEKCVETFPRELDLQRHISQVHEHQARHTCPHCGKSLT
ncbi:hypothetical protein T265_14278, partial [Opisthorchis viverrini]